MIDLSQPATQVFQTLRSFNHEVSLFDDDGNAVSEPEDARRFFAVKPNLLVSIVEDGDNTSIRMYMGRSTNPAQLTGLIDMLRNMTVRYNMLFNVRKYGRVLKVKDFATKSSVREDRNNGVTMKVFENMYGTTRSSYLKLENARMIVRHGSRVNENLIGARGRNIQAIFIENAIGERTLFPANVLSGARAMTQHVNQGGTFNDTVGQHILGMSESFANLATVSRHVQAHSHNLSESAFEIREEVRQQMRETRRMFERMFRPGGYKTEAAKIEEAANTLTEDGEEEINEMAANVESLRGLLTFEGIEISEKVLESVAKALKERQYAIPEARMKPGPVVSVLGQKVDQNAWEAFKQGKLDMNGRPQVPGRGFTTKAAEIFNKLSSIASVARNDSIANLLSHVAGEIEHGTATPVMQKVAMHALKAAGMLLETDFAENAEPIREFNEWLNGHTAERICAEQDDIPDLSDDEQSLDEEEFDEELSMEDVLLPTNQGKSLRREVTVKDTGCGDCDDPTHQHGPEGQGDMDGGQMDIGPTADLGANLDAAHHDDQSQMMSHNDNELPPELKRMRELAGLDREIDEKVNWKHLAAAGGIAAALAGSPAHANDVRAREPEPVRAAVPRSDDIRVREPEAVHPRSLDDLDVKPRPLDDRDVVVRRPEKILPRTLR